jgi:hypothetical protein
MKKLGYRGTRFVIPIPVLRQTCSELYAQFQWPVPYWSGQILPDALNALDAIDTPDSQYQWRYDREYIWENTVDLDQPSATHPPFLTNLPFRDFPNYFNHE